MKKLFFMLSALAAGHLLVAQCDTQVVSGDLIVTTNTAMEGVYQVSGKFKINAGVTVTVNPYSTNNCGKLQVNAAVIDIAGNIDGNFSGYPGGTGGNGATSITSVTGDETALNDCHNKDDAGQVTVGGGLSGADGQGPGKGLHGTNGSVGSGPKQVCQNTGDEFGMIAGAGGAGGGGGGSYGGAGSVAGNGGNGNANYTATGVTLNADYSILAGTGGAGGNSGAVYGTPDGADIDLGSGGAGAGGGGRSFNIGQLGGNGGKGGGAVVLMATDSLIVTGSIAVNGQDGAAGGKGGDGDQTSDCCSDACNDCGERTFSSGAGAGSGSGAGSGGGILLKGDQYVMINGTLDAKGGNSGTAGIKGVGISCNYSGGPFCGNQSVTTGDAYNANDGGSGGGGRIKIFYNDCPGNVINPTENISGGTGAAPGTYQEIQNSCWASVEEAGNTNTLAAKIFPNPVTDRLHILFTQSAIDETEGILMIFDAAGKCIRTSTVTIGNGQAMTVETSNLTGGIYNLMIITRYSVFTSKFIK